jgi:hypothetical protein
MFRKKNLWRKFEMFWNIQEYFQDEDIFGKKFSNLFNYLTSMCSSYSCTQYVLIAQIMDIVEIEIWQLQMKLFESFFELT